MTRTTKTVERLIREEDEEHDNRIEKIVLRVREDVLIPFCKKHDVRFLSGMGSWAFFLPKSPERHWHGGVWSETFRGSGALECLDKVRPQIKGAKRVLNQLHLRVDNTELACLLEDYDPQSEE